MPKVLPNLSSTFNIKNINTRVTEKVVTYYGDTDSCSISEYFGGLNTP